MFPEFAKLLHLTSTRKIFMPEAVCSSPKRAAPLPFSQQLQKAMCSTSSLPHCKLQFNLQFKNPVPLQCKLTCQAAFCEARCRHTSPLPAPQHWQKHLAEAEQTAAEVVRRSRSKVHQISFANSISHNLQFIAPRCTITAMTAQTVTLVLENHNEKQITEKTEKC